MSNNIDNNDDKYLHIRCYCNHLNNILSESETEPYLEDQIFNCEKCNEKIAINLRYIIDMEYFVQDTSKYKIYDIKYDRTICDFYFNDKIGICDCGNKYFIQEIYHSPLKNVLAKECKRCTEFRDALLNGSSENCYKNYNIEITYNKILEEHDGYCTGAEGGDSNITTTVIQRIYPLHNSFKIESFDEDNECIDVTTLNKFYALSFEECTGMSGYCGMGTNYEITNGRIINKIDSNNPNNLTMINDEYQKIASLD